MRLTKASRWLILTLCALILAALVMVSCNLIPNRDSGTTSIELPKGIPQEFKTLFEVYSALQQDHINASQLNPTVLNQGAIRGLLNSLNDPHASYLDPELSKKESERFRGSFEGIGAEVNLRDGQIVIVAPIPDSPAAKAGIRPGDVILEVNGESIRGLGIFEVVSKIRGPIGTPVELLLVHRNQPQPVRVTIIRGLVNVASVELRILTGGLAHLKINIFSETTDTELTEALERAERFKARGIILDLRNNPGGFVSTTVNTTSQFLKSGLVLYQVDGQGRRIEMPVKSGGKAQAIPIVVLINEFTASGSEIMAGAIRDHRRGLLLGTKTYGKGSVNIQRPLSDGSAIYYTIARWYTPNGLLIEGVGIEPDIEVQADPAGVDDLQLDKAIEKLQEQIAQRG